MRPHAPGADTSAPGTVSRRFSTAGRRRAGLAGAALACLFSAPAAPAQGEWSAGAGIAVRHLRFEEFDRQDSRLVREDGWLPGLLLEGEYRLARWRLGLTGAVYGGDIDYDGRTQSGQALETDTSETLYELGLRARYRLLALDSAPLSIDLLATADTRFWQRNIQGASGAAGLEEDYRWHAVGAGAACDYSAGAAGNFTLRATVFRTVDPRVEVHFDAAYDDAELNLKQRAGWRLDAGWSTALAAHTELALGAYLQQWEFGGSESRPLTRGGTVAGSVLQPRTESREAGISAQLRYRW